MCLSIIWPTHNTNRQMSNSLMLYPLLQMVRRVATWLPAKGTNSIAANQGQQWVLVRAILASWGFCVFRCDFFEVFFNIVISSVKLIQTWLCQTWSRRRKEGCQCCFLWVWTCRADFWYLQIVAELAVSMPVLILPQSASACFTYSLANTFSQQSIGYSI